jgi:hypothetical protein
MKSFIGGTANVSIMPGASISDAARDAIELATQIRGDVRFTFNSLDFRVDRHMTTAEVVSRYHAYCEFESLKAKAEQATVRDERGS